MLLRDGEPHHGKHSTSFWKVTSILKNQKEKLTNHWKQYGRLGKHPLLTLPWARTAHHTLQIKRWKPPYTSRSSVWKISDVGNHASMCEKMKRPWKTGTSYLQRTTMAGQLTPPTSPEISLYSGLVLLNPYFLGGYVGGGAGRGREDLLPQSNLPWNWRTRLVEWQSSEAMYLVGFPVSCPLTRAKDESWKPKVRHRPHLPVAWQCEGSHQGYPQTARRDSCTSPCIGPHRWWAQWDLPMAYGNTSLVMTAAATQKKVTTHAWNALSGYKKLSLRRPVQAPNAVASRDDPDKWFDSRIFEGQEQRFWHLHKSMPHRMSKATMAVLQHHMSLSLCDSLHTHIGLYTLACWG